MKSGGSQCLGRTVHLLSVHGGQEGRFDDAAVTKVVVEVADRLSDRLADATSAVHKTLELEIGELRGDPQLLDLMHASVEVMSQPSWTRFITGSRSSVSSPRRRRWNTPGGWPSAVYPLMRWCVPTA